MFTSYVKNKDSQDSIIFGDGNQGKVKGLGKIAITGEELAGYCQAAGFELMQIKEEHIFKLKTLRREESAPKHNDPFDRIMLAQSKEDNCKFITHDSLIPFYNEPCVINV